MTVAKLAAIRMAKCLALPLTFRNLHVIELALEAESQFAKVSITKAADTILQCAMAQSDIGEAINYFWFEDGCWRQRRLSFKERDEIRFQRRRY